VTKPQNMIVFLGENHTRHVTGAYGHPMVRTPSIDRIAREGALFHNAYCTSPICCPARASIATGRYPHQTGYWENSLAYDGRVPTWMRRLREQGHEVAAVGKLHFRATEDDNGFTEEILPMHIVEGVGGLVGLLRGSGEEPVRTGNWDMYVDVGPGETSYHAYDRRITRHAIEWLEAHQGASDKPWILCVHYGSAHPPFKAAERLLDLYPPDEMPMPVQWRGDERPRHPAIDHLRHILGQKDDIDETTLRQMVAGYFALISHLDEQVGEVIAAAEELGLLDSTRLLYTADHGDCFGNHFIFGKFNMYERSIGAPLMMCGEGISAGTEVNQITSHVDLFPTIVEAVRGSLTENDGDLPGVSLWPAISGHESDRVGFVEYHALGSKNASFVLRQGNMKLIYHVGMPCQLFDLADDPDETTDLVATERGRGTAGELESRLRRILDPEETDARAKADQRRRVDEIGGRDAILRRGGFPRTPAPGEGTNFTPVVGTGSF